MKPFKIAMLQCEFDERDECHSYHFAPFMDDCDPLVLKEVWPSSYQYHTDINHPNEFANCEKIDGFEFVSVWDVQGLERAERFSRYVDRRPRVCDTIEEAIDGVDAVFLADGGGDGSKHLEWVTPILKKRLPVFIDKPFADTYADAQAMVELANKMETPFFTASILSFIPEVDTFKASWARIPEPGQAVIKGVGPSNGAVIHGLALMQGLFGTGVEWVECMGDMPREIMHVHYANGMQVILLNTAYATFDWFRCEVWSRTSRTNPPKRMYAQSDTIGDPEFLPGTATVVRLFKQMLETGKPPIPYAEPIELAALMEAGLKAHESRERVFLRDVMGGE